MRHKLPSREVIYACIHTCIHTYIHTYIHAYIDEEEDGVARDYLAFAEAYFDMIFACTISENEKQT